MPEFSRVMRKPRHCASSFGQDRARCTRRAQYAGQPVERLADVGIFKSRGGELAHDSLAVVGDLGLLAILEEINQDVVHSAPFLLTRPRASRLPALRLFEALIKPSR